MRKSKVVFALVCVSLLLICLGAVFQRKIVNPHIHGVWYSLPSNGVECTAIYCSELEGPVVGLYGGGKVNQPCGVALSIDRTTGAGQIQLRDENGDLVFVDAELIRKLVDLASN